MKSKYNIIGNTTTPNLDNSTVKYALVGAIFIGSDSSIWQKINQKFDNNINNWRLLGYLDFTFSINNKTINTNDVITFESTNGITVTSSSNNLTFNLRFLSGTTNPSTNPGTNDLWIYVNNTNNSIWYWNNNDNTWNTNSAGSATLIDNLDGTYSYDTLTFVGTDEQTTSEINVGTPLDNYPSAITVQDALEEIFDRIRNAAVLEQQGSVFKNKSSNYKGSYSFNITDITGVTNYNKYFRVGIYEVWSEVSTSSSITAASQTLTPTVLPSNGDLIVLIIACETTGVTISAPVGFTLQDNYATPWGISVYTKTASGETGPYTASFSPNAGYRYIRMHVLRSLAGHALQVETKAKNTDASTSATPILCPALTSTKTYNYILDAIIYDTNTRTYTDATGYSSVTNDPGVYELVIQTGFHTDTNIEQRSVALSTGGSAYKVISLCITENVSNQSNKPSLTYVQTLPNGLYKITMTSSDGLGTTATTLRYFNAKHIILVNAYHTEATYRPTLKSAFEYINNYDLANADDYVIICSGNLGDTATITPIYTTNVIFLPNTTLNTGSNTALSFIASTNYTYRWYGLDKYTCIITSSNSSYTVFTGGSANPTDLTLSGFTIKNTNSTGTPYQINNTGIANIKDCIFTAYDLSKIALSAGASALSAKTRIFNCVFNGQLYLGSGGTQKYIHNCIINVYNTYGILCDATEAIIDNIVINLNTDGSVISIGMYIVNLNQVNINTIQNIKIFLTGASNTMYYDAPVICGLYLRNSDTDQVTLDNIYIESDGIGIISYTPSTNIKVTNSYIKAVLGFVRTSAITTLRETAWTNAEIYNSIIDCDTLGNVTFATGTPENNQNILITG